MQSAEALSFGVEFFARDIEDLADQPLRPGTHLNRRRIARCMEMMQRTDEALSWIAVACGLCDQAHLSRIFRRTQGMSPARWRSLRRLKPDDAA